MTFSNNGWSDAGVLSALVLNALIGGILLCVFCVLQKKAANAPLYQPRADPNSVASSPAIAGLVNCASMSRIHSFDNSQDTRSNASAALDRILRLDGAQLRSYCCFESRSCKQGAGWPVTTDELLVRNGLEVWILKKLCWL